jgi:ACS family tartrate transporter-like MFS transporter
MWFHRLGVARHKVACHFAAGGPAAREPMNRDASNDSERLDDRCMAIVWRSPASLAERTRRRVTLHLVPYLFFLYILAYLDRVNVAVAELKMVAPPSQGGMGFSRSVIGFGMGIFFWGYWILEIPSTVSVVRWGARWVFVRILILWGICAALVGTIGTPFASHMFGWLAHVPEHSPAIDSVDRVLDAVFGGGMRLVGRAGTIHPLGGSARFLASLHDNPAYQFYFLRFMLGFFEGGFFPSVIVYLSHWFRAEDRAKAIASFMAAIPLSSMLGMPLSGLLLGVNWFGLAGWRWIFIVEGIAPVLAGFATLFFLPSRPQHAAWLPPDERGWLVGELEREHAAKGGGSHWAWLHHLGIVLLLTLVYFCLNVTSYGLSMFMPAIIKSQSGTSNRAASALAALPYVMALIAMLFNGRHSDRHKERIWHVAVPLVFWSLGIWAASLTSGVALLPMVIMIFWVGTCMYAHLPAFWPIPTMFLGATAAASAIGFINMVGNLGGSVGPMVVGNVVAQQKSIGTAASVMTYIPMVTAPGGSPGPAVVWSAAAERKSFGPALMRVAPWPMVAVTIVLAIRYTQRRRI